MIRRALAAEFVGSLLLAATVIGSGIAAERLSGGNVALALLANSLATGAMLYVLIVALADVSGAHFNPAVSVALAVRKAITLRVAAFYTLAQVAGMVLGAVLAHAMFGLPSLQISMKGREELGFLVGEVVATGGLVFVVLALAGRRVETIATAVGLYIVAAYWFTSSTSFANPAITIARAMTDTFAGIAPTSAPWFVVAQFVGVAFALFVASSLITSSKE
ncbi:MAG TPA: aquaporin [Xanthobacteraceae bacterium]|nr:aquaporin [Xanthobacteraceae bacterium]